MKIINQPIGPDKVGCGKISDKTIVFAEVRSKTNLFMAVANSLYLLGYQVVWIVENLRYKPNPGRVYRIRYPKNIKLSSYKIPEKIRQKVARSDRIVKYFGGSTQHYGYYWQKIREILVKEKPICIFGELGNFHTHLCALAAEDLRIPYLDPETTRYPPGHFSFHAGLRYQPCVSNELDALSDERIDQLIEDIIHTRVVPDYMVRQRGLEALKIKLRIILYKLFVVFAAYITGEHYATQSPMVYIVSKFTIVRNKRLWEKRSVTIDHLNELRAKGKRLLLYPLQMQPEFNLDVWGAEYNDQVSLLSEILESLPKEWQLVIKPNPKSNLEMSRDLREFINSYKTRALPVSHSAKMSELLPVIDNVITVTGTIAIERVLAQHPVLVLGESPIKKFGSAISLEFLKDIYKAIEEENIISTKQSKAGARELIRYLLSHSHVGTIGEPIGFPYILGKENIKALTKAFVFAIEKARGLNP